MSIEIGTVIVCDVSGWDEPDPRPEVHRFGGRQDGSRKLPDGSETGGLGVTVCGIEQATRGHGWWVLQNAYQREQVRNQRWPLCTKCNVTEENVLA